MSSGSEMATTLIINARTVPTGTSLLSSTSAIGIMPVSSIKK
jgi:hypothetical protein